ncbi:DUF2953 domain-containing protein [Calidifontibacillus erzurumensis]|uniref:DUF2953 domain-containing protein n=1 Tax=Calidifontibacillus erzurumensis TaxID=2741433 RepID=A0A8J8GC97_9BACI|nr:DUF2953 domain-containing protein [Calidifontibacillus erzurumensis]NSL51300.1 DUF2953 domain-containing protein [Calidifontibacillus erzurumensis]
MVEKGCEGMMLFLLIVLVIIVLLFLLSFTKLKIKVDLSHNNESNHFKITIKALFGLISYTIDVPLLKIDTDHPSLIVKNEQKVGKSHVPISENTKRITVNDILKKIEQVKEFIDHVIHFHEIVKKFLKKISIHKFEWHTSFGLGDAAQTGIASGLLWSAKGTIVGLLSKAMNLMTMPQLSITPSFQDRFATTRLICIFSFRIGHAMVGAFRVVKYWKSVKGGQRHVRTSNSRFDEYSYGKLEAND